MPLICVTIMKISLQCRSNHSEFPPKSHTQINIPWFSRGKTVPAFVVVIVHTKQNTNIFNIFASILIESLKLNSLNCVGRNFETSKNGLGAKWKANGKAHEIWENRCGIKSNSQNLLRCVQCANSNYLISSRRYDWTGIQYDSMKCVYKFNKYRTQYKWPTA